MKCNVSDITRNITSIAGAQLKWPGCPNGYLLDNCTYVTAPQASYMKETYLWMWKIVPPILIVFGIVGNICTICVLLRSSKRLTSISQYLLVLACSDTVFLLNAPLRQWIRFVWSWDIRDQNNVLCKLSAYLTYATYHFSAWILVAVTMERGYSVLWPHRVKSICTRKTSVAIIAVIFTGIFLLNVHTLYGVYLNEQPGMAQKSRCQFLNSAYENFFSTIWNWINFSTAFIGPFSLLFIGNIVIINGIRKSHNLQKQMCAASSTANVKNSSITPVLILLSFVFFISQTPTIYFLYYPFHMKSTRQLPCEKYALFVHEEDTIWLIYTVTSLVSYINTTVNFAIYFFSGRRFREEILRMLRCQQSNGRAFGEPNPSSLYSASVHAS
ncbi:hypothetical protein DPMN_091827 [Dreissena polymorpha]|uniref:G-protein coupled receptors family 1 profile domain-containing protein n=1 Tax=Dreissena polymorpha TaxID=45954 RepID=A0A9D4L077_DREPO|nr:hypothetical protein DPMN_091827 [Dreissena polymorpha]